MFSYIRGILCECRADHIVLEAGGIGYLIYTPGVVAEELPPVGKEVKVYTHLQVKEDSLTLYGFLNRDDLSVFELLIAVSGIGPKGALSILSELSADDLRFAVLSDDVKTICRAPGIGQKTAQRLILELRDKLSLSDAFEEKMAHAGSEPADTLLGQVKDDALLALTALGYSQAQSLRALREVELTEGMEVEDVLRSALLLL